MKHLGLIIAIVLGVIGAFVNFIYLSNKAANREKIAFLGIRHDVSIRRGETFREDHFAPIEIPKLAVSAQLSESALRFANRSTVVGMKATRDYAGGEMVLDPRTPAGAPVGLEAVAYRVQPFRQLERVIGVRHQVSQQLRGGAFRT